MPDFFEKLKAWIASEEAESTQASTQSDTKTETQSAEVQTEPEPSAIVSGSPEPEQKQLSPAPVSAKPPVQTKTAGLTRESIENMSLSEVNKNWDAIKTALKE